MNYRLATESDIEKLSNLRWEHESEENTIQDSLKDNFMKECNSFLREGIQNGSWVYWIAEKDDEIISNIYIHRIRKVPKPQKLFAEIGYVTNVHAIADYRNQGIGSQLLKYVKEWANDAGLELLFLWPSHKSANFYAREGFHKENDIIELEF